MRDDDSGDAKAKRTKFLALARTLPELPISAMAVDSSGLGRNVYVASTLSNSKEVRRVMRVLHRAGHKITYDWTRHGSVQEQGIERIKEVAVLELRGVLQASVLVCLLPGGRGTHVELGAALGMGKWVILKASEEEMKKDGYFCSFYFHPLVVRVTSDDELLTTLGKVGVR